MEAAHMTFEEETLRLRSECKQLRLENTRLKRQNSTLPKKVFQLEQENLLLEKGNNLLKQKQTLLLEKQQQLEKQIESLTLIIEELRRMVFGKKKTKDNGDKSSEGTKTNNGQTNKRKPADRSKESYRRAAPKDAEVTDVYEHKMTHCS